MARLEKDIVGILTFAGGKRPRVQHAGEMAVSVLKKYWGLKIGSRLIEYLIKWAQATKIIKKINLRVLVNNKRAIKLYKKI